MRRRVLAVLALAVVGASVSIGISAAMHPVGPLPRGLVTIRHLTATSALGSYCIDAASHEDTHAVTCGEGAYPLHPRGRLPAPPEALVRVRLNHAASVASARLVRVDGDQFEFVGAEMDGTPVNKSGRRWRFRLPEDLQGADALSISTAGDDGEDANLWAGLRPVARWPRGGGDAAGRRAAFVTTKRLTARATIGTHCLPSNGAMGCADYAYPLKVRGHLPATPGARVRVALRRRATAVTASLVRQDGDDFEFVGPTVTATPSENGKRWRLLLPDDLDGANRLSIDVDYADGDANYWAGLRPVERWP